MSRKRVSIRPRGNGSSGVTLFPFLAVLLCTMGALIMLLVVIARNVREQAEQIPEPPPIEHIEPQPAVTVVEEKDEERMTVEQAEEILRQIEMGREEAEWFAEGFSKSKVDAEKKYAEARAWLAAAEKESQRLKDEIERLAALSEQLDRKDAVTPAELEQLKRLLVQKQEQRQAAEAALEQLQKEAESASKSYAIIPYRGTGGTFRRPIYIECRDGKVIIQPEGIELTEADFLASDRPDNPLDAALRVVRQYYAETNQIQRGTEPYPLIVVRPSGVEAYSAARQAMGSWINEFGYELIDEDWAMQYPAPSEELRQRLEKQLDTSRHRLQGYLAALRAQQQGTPRPGRQYRVDSKGVVQPLETPGDFGASDLRRNNASRNGGSPNGASPGGGDSNNSARNGGSPNSALPGGGVPNSARNGGTVPPNGNGIEHDGLMADGVYRPNARRLPQTEGGQNPVPLFPYGRGGDEKVSDLTPVERQRLAPGSVPNASSGPNGGDANLVGEETLYGMKKPESLQGEQTPLPVTSEGGQPYAAGAGVPAKGQQPPTNPLIGLTPDASGMPVLGAAVSTNPELNSQPTDPNKPPMPQAVVDDRKAKEAPPIKSQKPNDWALRNMKPFAAAVSRNVKVQCEADKFVLVPQPGLIGATVVPIGPSVGASTEQLVLAIWDYMDSWGIAGEKYYWKPVLKVKVLPGGEQRFEELRWLLRNSGFVLERME